MYFIFGLFVATDGSERHAFGGRARSGRAAACWPSERARGPACAARAPTMSSLSPQVPAPERGLMAARRGAGSSSPASPRSNSSLFVACHRWRPASPLAPPPPLPEHAPTLPPPLPPTSLPPPAHTGRPGGLPPCAHATAGAGARPAARTRGREPWRLRWSGGPVPGLAAGNTRSLVRVRQPGDGPPQARPPEAVPDQARPRRAGGGDVRVRRALRDRDRGMGPLGPHQRQRGAATTRRRCAASRSCAIATATVAIERHGRPVTPVHLLNHPRV